MKSEYVVVAYMDTHVGNYNIVWKHTKVHNEITSSQGWMWNPWYITTLHM
jgi:hypothetical protein